VKEIPAGGDPAKVLFLSTFSPLKTKVAIGILRTLCLVLTLVHLCRKHPLGYISPVSGFIGAEHHARSHTAEDIAAECGSLGVYEVVLE
jgi:hypothetical protein